MSTNTERTTPAVPAESTRRSVRWWRMAFIAYAIALTTGTHWPALELAPSYMPATDKIVHLYGFAGLTLLFWRSRFVRSPWQVLSIMLVWALLDELTQAIPILRRQFSVQDVIASSLGVTLVVAWGAALRPVGGPINRQRLALQQALIDVLFSRAFAWIIFVAAAAPIGLSLTFILPRAMLYGPRHPAIFSFGFALAAWIGLMLFIWQRLWSRTIRQALTERWCHRCLTPQPALGSRRGWDHCATCSAAVHPAQWQPPPILSAQQIAHLGRPAILIGVTTMVTLFTLIWGLAWLFRVLIADSATASATHQVMRAAGGISTDLLMAIDLTTLLLAGAVATILYRRALARTFDEQDQRCRQCGHDLSHTPVDTDGHGRCGECGTSFALVDRDLTQPSAPDSTADD